MKNEKFWRVVCKYGHVGRRNEVSVSRFITTPGDYNIIDVLDIVQSMPGVKKSNFLSGIVKAEPISEEEYIIGKASENENFYLINLKSRRYFEKHEIIA